MIKGTVIRFNKVKGYGFIRPENGTEEIFAHYSSIQSEGYKSLEIGQKIEFEIEQGERGKFAKNIRVID